MFPVSAHRERGFPAATLLASLLTSFLLTALLLGGCALPRPAPLTRPAPAPLNGAVLTPPQSIPDLTLQRVDGRPFQTAELQGRISLFFFGYTFCPDVCPLTLVEVAQVRRLLGAEADRLDAYFVTVDPARDTPERMGPYVKGFDPAIEALTGEPAMLEQLRAAFGAVAERREAPDGGPVYFMDHTAAIFLVDATGSVGVVFSYGTPPEEIAADVRQISRQQSTR